MSWGDLLTAIEKMLKIIQRVNGYDWKTLILSETLFFEYASLNIYIFNNKKCYWLIFVSLSNCHFSVNYKKLYKILNNP